LRDTNHSSKISTSSFRVGEEAGVLSLVDRLHNGSLGPRRCTIRGKNCPKISRKWRDWFRIEGNFERIEIGMTLSLRLNKGKTRRRRRRGW